MSDDSVDYVLGEDATNRQILPAPQGDLHLSWPAADVAPREAGSNTSR
jgi:hypothetical protein